MTKRAKNSTLKAVLDVILYESPSTQDEIADKLGLTRRYVTKLLQPLVKKGVVRRAYILDLKKFDEFSEIFQEEPTSREHAGSYLIKEMLSDMAKHVCHQLEMSFEAFLSHDTAMAEDALKQDYITNNMHEKVRSSVETVVSINPYSEFSKTIVFGEIAYDLERIGDHSCHIANFALNESYEVDDETMAIIKTMFETSRKMVTHSMNAFTNEKLDLKDKVMDYEEKLHSLQQEAMNRIAHQMAEDDIMDQERSTYYIYLSRVVKAFERIGDISIEIIDTAGEFYRNIPRTTTPERFQRR
ncbi:MAG TPA: PhoU domain-containing protein [Methanobacteriaceae archaeon]|nr:PhoU domain-containing protein [Methanobacteriaceae archaeon]